MSLYKFHRHNWEPWKFSNKYSENQSMNTNKRHTISPVSLISFPLIRIVSFRYKTHSQAQTKIISGKQITIEFHSTRNYWLYLLAVTPYSYNIKKADVGGRQIPSEHHFFFNLIKHSRKQLRITLFGKP